MNKEKVFVINKNDDVGKEYITAYENIRRFISLPDTLKGTSITLEPKPALDNFIFSWSSGIGIGNTNFRKQ